MKVFWLINVLMPAQSHRVGRPVLPIAGWIEGLCHGLHGRGEIELIICSVSDAVSQTEYFAEDGITYIIVPQIGDLSASFKAVLDELCPDLVHVFGTEAPHSLALSRVSDPDKTMIQIQGLLAWCEPKLMLGLPAKYRRVNPFKWLMLKRWGGDLIALLAKQYRKAGRRELEILSRTKHILGHTNWDRAIAQQLTNGAEYHRFSEILRPAFYSGESWNHAACRPYSIFISQAMYPIKGFHMMLEVLDGIVADFPQTHVYIAGGYPKHLPGEQWRVETMCEYFGYLQRTIRSKHLEQHVTLLGLCDEHEMKHQYLQANAYVSCSSIENESNSLSEAKMLGVPCVASYVGGVTDRITHGESGLHYPFNEPEMLRYYIRRIFENPALAAKLSAGARQEAQETNNPERVTDEIIAIYRSVLLRESGDQ